MMKTTLRFSWAGRRGEGRSAGTAMASGGDNGPRGREGEVKQRAGWGRVRGRADPDGNVVIIGGIDVCWGKQEVEAGARAGATHLPVLLAGGGRRPCPWWAGLYSWAAQVMRPRW